MKRKLFSVVLLLSILCCSGCGNAAEIAPAKTLPVAQVQAAPAAAVVPSVNKQPTYKVEIIREPVYSELYSASSYAPWEAMHVEKNGRYGYVDMYGNELGEIDYDGVGTFQDGIGVVQKDGKWAAILLDGKLLRPEDPFFFDGETTAVNGFLPIQMKVGMENPWLIMDKTGRILGSEGDSLQGTEFEYVAGTSTASPHILHVMKDGLEACIGNDGEVIGGRWFRRIRWGDEDSAAGVTTQDGEDGIWKKDGSYIPLPEGYSFWHDHFSEGSAPVYTYKGRQLAAYIKEDGTFLNDLHFDQAGTFFGGKAVVMLDGKYGMISSDGTVWGGTENIRFDELTPLYQETRTLQEHTYTCVCAAVRIGDKWGLLDANGHIAGGEENIRFDEIDNFSDGYANVRIGIKQDFMDLEGRLLSGGEMPAYYADEDDYMRIRYRFSNGLASISMDGEKYGFIKTDGSMLFEEQPFRFLDSFGFFDGLASVRDEQGTMVIDTAGNIVVPYGYSQFRDGAVEGNVYTMFMQKDGLWGVLRVTKNA